MARALSDVLLQAVPAFPHLQYYRYMYFFLGRCGFLQNKRSLAGRRLRAPISQLPFMDLLTPCCCSLCATTALVLLGAAAGQVACLMFGAALSAQCHQPYYLCGLCQHPPQPYMVQGCLSRWQRMILSAAWESLLPCCN